MNGPTPMDAVRAVPALRALLDGADHADAKAFTSRRGLRDGLRIFLARMTTYEPGWYKALYAVRGVLAGWLGLKHGELFDAAGPGVDLAPGGKVGFITTESADPGEEPRWWIGRVDDRHLSGWVGVTADPEPDGTTRFVICTVVRYHHWTGPLYFNLIRPAHHIVVRAMGRYAARG